MNYIEKLTHITNQATGSIDFNPKTGSVTFTKDGKPTSIKFIDLIMGDDEVVVVPLTDLVPLLQQRLGTITESPVSERTALELWRQWNDWRAERQLTHPGSLPRTWHLRA